MIVCCRKIVSRTTGVDLGDTSQWLTRNKEYVVLALNFFEGVGIDIFIQTEDHKEPRFISLTGFEIIDQRIPSSWILTSGKIEDRSTFTLLPAAWNAENFFIELENQDEKAITLFNNEVEKIYEELLGPG